MKSSVGLLDPVCLGWMIGLRYGGAQSLKEFRPVMGKVAWGMPA